MTGGSQYGERQALPGSAGPAGPPPPREVRLATSLLIAVGAVLLVNAVLAVVFLGDLRTAAQEQLGDMVPAGQITGILIGSAVVLLVLGGLLVLAAMFLRRGRQWARVLAFVGGGTLILFSGVGALAGAGFLAVLLLGASVGIVALLMQGAVAPFFDRPRSSR